VTGMTAGSKDFNDTMKSHLPIVFAFVLGLAFILLLVTFRSIVIPIKAIVLNLLSVGAAYGILTLVFQDGHRRGPARLPLDRRRDVVAAAVPVRDPVRPVDGLPRVHPQPIREAVDGGMSTDRAVAHGIKQTAGVVTSAAVVMVAVFAIFATLSSLEFKQMGVGLAAAVLIDATDRAGRAAARDDEAPGRLELVPAAQAGLAPAARPRARPEPAKA
jgi:RND superfamily putative drug exporter